jgi:hypothetical protein
MRYLPLSIFFNRTVPRADAVGDHCCRWLPLYPAGELLTELPLLRVTKKGYLLPPQVRGRDGVEILVTNCQTYPHSRVVLRQASTANAAIVDIQRLPGDSFASKETGFFCFFLQTQSATRSQYHLGDRSVSCQKMAGAIFRANRFLHITNDGKHSDSNRSDSDHADDISLSAYSWQNKNMTREKTGFEVLEAMLEKPYGKLHLVHDCPITVTLLDCNPDDLTDVRVLKAKALPESWCIQIERGKKPRRRYRREHCY